MSGHITVDIEYCRELRTELSKLERARLNSLLWGIFLVGSARRSFIGGVYEPLDSLLGSCCGSLCRFLFEQPLMLDLLLRFLRLLKITFIPRGCTCTFGALSVFKSILWASKKKSYKMLFSTVHLKELKIGRFIVKHEFRDQILK